MRDESYLMIGNPFKNGKFLLDIIGFCIVFCLPLWLIYYGLSNKPYISLGSIIFGMIILVPTIIWGVLNIKSRKIIKISLTQIQVKGLLGRPKIIERNNVQSFFEEEKSLKTKNGYSKWKELRLFSEETTLQLSSEHYSNYVELRNILVEGVSLLEPEGKKEESHKEYINKIFNQFLYLCISLFIVISLPYLNFFYKKLIKSDIKFENLIEIRGTINDYPQKLTQGKSRRETGFSVELTELPYFEFNFYIEQFATKTKYDSFKDVMLKGSSVGIYISTDEYKKKISKEIPIKFNDKYFGYNNIKTFGAKCHQFDWKNKGSLEKEEINKENDTDIFTSSYIILIYIWIGIVTFLMIFISQKWNEYSILKEYENY